MARVTSSWAFALLTIFSAIAKTFFCILCRRFHARIVMLGGFFVQCGIDGVGATANYLLRCRSWDALFSHLLHQAALSVVYMTIRLPHLWSRLADQTNCRQVIHCLSLIQSQYHKHVQTLFLFYTDMPMFGYGRRFESSLDAPLKVDIAMSPTL